MKSMKFSAIVLGLAAAGAFAQSAPEAADPAAEATTQPAVEAPAAEPVAQPAEQPAVEQAAAPATEQQVAAEQPSEQPKEETSAETSSIVSSLNISKADAEPEAKKAVEFKISGQAEFDAYGYWKNDDNQDFFHSYSSTVDVDFQVKFNDQWSAQVEIEADGASTNPGAYYSGAFVQYQKNDNFAIKFGDLTFSEGAFNYYDYSDPTDNAAGMTEHDIRGLELNLYGLQLGLGFGRGGNDVIDTNVGYGKGYDVHAAYQLDLAGQALRPYVHYKSFAENEGKENELHTGLEAALEFGPFAIHAVYGLHLDNNTSDDPSATHAFLAEPTFKVSSVNIKTGIFYALFNDDLNKATIHGTEIPEYLFGYIEGDLKINDALTVGLLGELHTNSLDDDTDLGTVNVGTRIYFTPVDGLEVTGFATAIIPTGDDWDKAGHESAVSTYDYGEDLFIKLGVETVFSF